MAITSALRSAVIRASSSTASPRGLAAIAVIPSSRSVPTPVDDGTEALSKEVLHLVARQVVIEADEDGRRIAGVARAWVVLAARFSSASPQPASVKVNTTTTVRRKSRDPTRAAFSDGPPRWSTPPSWRAHRSAVVSGGVGDD